MTQARIARLVFALTLAGFVAAVAWCGVSLVRGEWNEFASWLAQLPVILKHPGRRRTFLNSWMLPLAVAYLFTLAAGIFWGLRRVEIVRR